MKASKFMDAQKAFILKQGARVLERDTSTCHYHSRRPDQTEFGKRIREIAETRVRHGCRRVQFA